MVEWEGSPEEGVSIQRPDLPRPGRMHREEGGSKPFSTKNPSYVNWCNGQKIVLHGDGLMRF